MKTKSKALLLSLCAVMLVVASVMGTMAYLTSQDSVTNTFTVGRVSLLLDEAKIDEDGKEITGEGAGRVETNEYHLLPGHVYGKDPTVHVQPNSEESYVRMRVTINKQKELDEIFKTINDARKTAANGGTYDVLTIADVLTGSSPDWQLVQETEDTSANSRTYEFRYTGSKYQGGKKGTVRATKADETIDLPDLFTEIRMPGEITGAQLDKLYKEGAEDNLTITVVADAIQADGFADADAAWEAFN